MNSVQIPSELLACICDYVCMKDLPNFMLISRTCHYFAEKRLYSSIDLDFFDTHQRRRSVGCVETLATCPSASATVRHLMARGLGLVEPSTRAYFMAALAQAPNISHFGLLIILAVDPPFFSEPLVQSPDFLPSLTSLNVDDPDIIVRLGAHRHLETVCIQGTIQAATYEYDGVIAALSGSALSIKHLRLKLGISGEHMILSSFFPVSGIFHSLVSLSIQFVLPAPPLTWEYWLELLYSMTSALRNIESLRMLSLVTLPDPILPLQEIQMLTRSAAEKLFRDHLPRLHRIEIRWHGWLTPAAVGKWVPITQDKLLRRNWDLVELS